MTEKPSVATLPTPDVDATELREMKVDELNQETRDKYISVAAGMRKEELVKEVANVRSKGVMGAVGGDSHADADNVGARPEADKIRHGDGAANSLKNSRTGALLQ